MGSRTPAVLQVIALAWVAAQAQEPAFRSDLILVAVDAEVTDRARMIDNLRKSDFVIWDNDTPQPILYFSQGQEPLDIVLLFDVSGSMKANLEKTTAAAAAALTELRSGDRVAVMAFAGKTRVLLPFSGDLSKVAKTLERNLAEPEFGGSTRLLAAIDEVIKVFAAERRQHRRRFLLVFTDDYGRKSLPENAVVTRLWESDIVVTGVLIQDPREVKVRKVTRFVLPTIYFLGQRMDRIAERTGGEMVKVEGDPAPVFRDTMVRLRTRYSLYYAMPNGNPGETRRVRVELGGEARRKYPNGQVRARRGYQVPVVGSEQQ